MTQFDAQPEDSTGPFDASEPAPSARQMELEFLVALGWTMTLGETRTGMMLVQSLEAPKTAAETTTFHICLSDRFDGLSDLESN